MKKLILLAALLFVSTAARAEDAKVTDGPKMTRQAPAPESGASFGEHKAKILKRMEERQAEAQKRKACVEAARDSEALKLCKPKRGPKGPKPAGGPEKDGHGHDGPEHDGPDGEDDTPSGQ